MSLAQPEQAGNRQSPGLTLSLSSNNPFRNRAVSPASSSEQQSPFEAPPRPVSRNPFLDTSAFPQPPSSSSPDKMSFPAGSTSKPALTGNAAELFDNLSLHDKPVQKTNGMQPPAPLSNAAGKTPILYSRPENVPPKGSSSHRLTRSQEEAMRARRTAGSSSRRKPSAELDIFADPSESPRKPASRRPRRNSESSIMERNDKLLNPEEEKKRDERRRRERKRREREGKDGKTKKPDRKLDIIDKLDVTSIYGTGLFHHDGPFDACNPHRNRQGSRRAPMQAFPKDSLNNALGGGGPLQKRPDHATFLGNNDGEAFKDYSTGGMGNNGYEPYNDQVRPGTVRQQPQVQSATTRIEPIHGEETLGLGTSTFLEGAPASKTAMQRRDSEHAPATEGGLSRKMSLAQKIRGMNANRRDNGSGRVTSPDGAVVSPDAPPLTPGGHKITESNPFFNEFRKSDDRRKESITIVEPEKVDRTRPPSSPRRGLGERLERRATSDGSSGTELQQPKPSGGFLSRVKSLKGGPRKPRAEKPLPQPQES